MKKTLLFALILIGFSAMSGQIVLMRELLVVFYGNELSLGITLASWLFWVAVGSWGIGRWLVSRIRGGLVALSLAEIILAFLLPLSLLSVRLVPLWLNYLPGEIIGVLAMCLATFLLLAPICVLVGFLFVLSCQIYKTHSEELKFFANKQVSESLSPTREEITDGAGQIGYVYILEAIGASLGGLITSLFLIRLLPPLYIMFLVGLLNLLAAFLLLRQRKILAIFSGVLMIIFVFLIFSGQLDLLRQRSLNLQWRDSQLLVSQNSVYGNIAITKREDTFSVFNNGLHSFSLPDKFSSEQKAHFPLLEHPHPKKVLMIGAGLSGQLREALKHPLESLDYVELDPLLISLAKKFLPYNPALNDSRLRVISDMDGRLFIKRTKEIYDVLIINLPPPNTAQLNRFYTREFYQEAQKVLGKRGILCFSLSSNPNYISDEQLQLYLTLRATLEDVFPEVIITPGETNFFLAAKSKGTLTLDWRVLMQRLKQRKIETRYMREYYLYSELSEERIDFFEDRLGQAKATAINRDFKPIAYYYSLVLWNTYFKYNLKKLFSAMSPQRIYIGAAFIYFILLALGWFSRRRKNVARWPILVCVGTTGFAEISFQIVTLICFQVIYGYVYYKLGIIFTSYMIGLILGGLFITRRLEKEKLQMNSTGADYRLFCKTQIAIFIYPLILPLLFGLFLSLKGKFSFWLGSNIVFTLLPLIPGFIGGLQFPLANKLYLKGTGLGVSHAAGLTYGIDIFGGCLGAILTAVFLIPIIGIFMTCLLAAGLNLVGLILLRGYSANTSAVKM